MVKGPSRALVTACRRPGVRPKGAENAMMVARLLSHRRQHWPATHPLRDFVFGLSTHALLKRPAAAALAAARQRHLYRLAIAQANGTLPLRSRRVYDAFRHGAAAWEQPWRMVLTAAVMSPDDTPRFVVPSLEEPSAQRPYEDRYCARGQSENALQALPYDWRSALPSATTFLANPMRLFLACPAYVLRHAWRVNTFAQTALAQAQPAPVRLTLVKRATQVTQYTERMRLPLPSACPIKAFLHRVTAVLDAVPTPAWNPA
jgi:hypothetical protein